MYTEPFPRSAVFARQKGAERVTPRKNAGCGGGGYDRRE